MHCGMRLAADSPADAGDDDDDPVKDGLAHSLIMLCILVHSDNVLFSN